MDLTGKRKNMIRSAGKKCISWGKDKARTTFGGEIKCYRQKEAILSALEKEMGKDLEALSRGKVDMRRIVMDLLYRYGGIKGPEVGAVFEVDYSAVSQEEEKAEGKTATRQPAKSVDA